MKKQDCQLLVHVAKPLWEEVELAAAEEGRSKSDVVRRLLVPWATARVIERTSAPARAVTGAGAA